MMMNLFSIFDPSTSTYLTLNWMSTSLILLFTPNMYWAVPSRLHQSWKLITNTLYQELKNLFSKKKMKFVFLIISMFWFILINNFMGLFPYIFTSTSHLSLTTMMALPIWLTLMLFGWINQTNSMFSHMVPLGTPMLLSSFMVIIETVSNMIRPLTLSVRLTANMISGHLLLCLLSNIMENMPVMNLLILPFMIILLTLETAVAIIQSYVFITLSSLYLNELN
uniref:ATP synthase F0 subunit 6 n=1 Tax=Alectorobius rudis TaxID=2058922 RepID=UPI0022386341|nr:ATP synthase F0 subunit 6 [Alectorobius rudis]UYB78617.1 ATP synthase F0 subunit 6 [Alectorobius rudis]